MNVRDDETHESSGTNGSLDSGKCLRLRTHLTANSGTWWSATRKKQARPLNKQIGLDLLARSGVPSRAVSNEPKDSTSSRQDSQSSPNELRAGRCVSAANPIQFLAGHSL